MAIRISLQALPSETKLGFQAVTVLPGVTIGKGVTVGTGSVVTKNLSPGVFAAGVPAKVIKKARSNKLEVDAKHEVMLNILSDFYKYASKFLKLRHIHMKN